MKKKFRNTLVINKYKVTRLNMIQGGEGPYVPTMDLNLTMYDSCEPTLCDICYRVPQESVILLLCTYSEFCAQQ